MEIPEEQKEAVNDIYKLVVSKIENEKNVIAPIEAIATSARLAGSLLFRSFNFNIKNAKHGSVILSENANLKGPELINITYASLLNFGIVIDNEKVKNGAELKSEIGFVDAINLVQNEALEIKEKYNLSYEQLAQSTAITTALIIKQINNIRSETAFVTAIYYYIEGSKTFPPEFKTKINLETTNQNKKRNNESKPWWKIW